MRTLPLYKQALEHATPPLPAQAALPVTFQGPGRLVLKYPSVVQSQGRLVFKYPLEVSEEL